MRWDRFARFAVVPLAAALSIGATATAMAQNGPPAPLPLQPIEFPAYHERQLENGAQVIVVEDPSQPLVTVNLRLRGGSSVEPGDLAGLAAGTAELLDKGTPNRTALEIAETMDFVGATLSASASDDWTSVTTTTLTEYLDTALVVMSEVVREPTFPQEELEIERRRTLSALQVELSQPQAVAERRFLGQLYGEHPYGALPTPESVRAMTRERIVDYHRKHYRPENALFVVAGDVTADEVVDRLAEHFGDWQRGAAPAPAKPTPPERTDRDVYLYHKPGSVQAVVRVGHLMAPATDPDWIALDVAFRILGGGSTGWLFEVLREEKGYTYGAYASTAKRIDRGYFQAGAEVRNEVADSAMAELFRLLQKLGSEPVPAEDLKLAKDYITGSFPRRIETPQQVAGELATARLRGLPSDYVESYRDRVAAVTASDVQRVARKHLDPSETAVVAVGDATAILDKLKPYGTIHLFDVEGNPMTPEDLEVRAAEVTFDPSILEPGTYVYSLLVQGNPIGDFTTEVARETADGRELIHARTRGGGMGLTIEEDVRFDAADFTPVSFNLEQGTPQGSLVVDLAYADGRVTGQVVTLQGDTTRVDTEVVDGTILPGMDGYVVWLADYEAMREVEVPAFNALSGSAYTLRAEVTGETTVTVPAGEFEVYQIELTTAQGTQHLLARKQAPHIVVRQELATQPIVFELKEIR